MDFDENEIELSTFPGEIEKGGQVKRASFLPDLEDFVWTDFAVVEVTGSSWEWDGF